jgi:hypothetical protein
MFFFAGFLAGPNHHFNQYQALIHGLLSHHRIIVGFSPRQVVIFLVGRVTPSPIVPALSKLCLSFVFLAIRFLPAIFSIPANIELLADDQYNATVLDCVGRCRLY